MPRPRSRLFLLVAEVALLFGVVAVAEASLRWYVSRPDTTLYPEVFPWPVTTAKYLAFRDLDEPVDVLLMGMSQMMRVDAARLGEIVAAPPAAAFNFAAPLHTVEFDRRLLEDVIVHLHKPRVLVYGLIPTAVPMEQTRAATAERVDALPVFSAYAPTPPAALRRVLLHDLDLLLYRGPLSRLLAGRGAKGTDFWIATARRVSRSGDTPVPGGHRSNPDGLILNVDERRHLAKLLRDFAAEMATTPLFANLEALAQTCRDAGIRLVLVNNPVHPIYRDLLAGGAADHERFLARVHETGAALGVPVFDPVADGLGDPGFYVDATHHNSAGMAWLTETVGRYLLAEHVLAAPQPVPS